MRVCLAVFVTAFLASVSAVFGCSCTAPDGSCTASASCSGGCYAICGASGCTSGCSGHGFPQVAGVKGTERTLTFSGDGITASALQNMAEEELGARLLFVPRAANDQLKVELHDISAADLFHGLSKVGAVALVAPDQSQIDKAESLHFYLKAENVEAGTVVTLLRQIFGDSAVVKAAAPESRVSLDLENVTLQDLRDTLPKLTGIRATAAPSN